LSALTDVLAVLEAMPAGVEAAVAWLDAPAINPANAAAASKPVEEPRILVVRFMVLSFQR
jgi:hypothetical protein